MNIQKAQRETVSDAMLVGIGVFLVSGLIPLIISFFVEERLIARHIVQLATSIVFLTLTAARPSREKWLALFTYDVIIILVAFGTVHHYGSMSGGLFSSRVGEVFDALIAGFVFLLMLGAAVGVRSVRGDGCE